MDYVQYNIDTMNLLVTNLPIINTVYITKSNNTPLFKQVTFYYNGESGKLYFNIYNLTFQ
jgi:hypothetical protein